MNDLSINQKVLGSFALLFLVAIISGFFIMSSLDKASEDTDILDALGRQRMLTQAMGKSALGFAMAKSRMKTPENEVSSLDHYITNMRGAYTKSIIGVAKKTKLKISMHPFTESKPAVPFPATFTRMVNQKFGKDRDFKVDIIAEEPVNPKQGLKTEMDIEANAWLKDNSDKIFTRTFENDGKLSIALYSTDKATLKVCADCHTKIMKKKFNVGDILGIRKYVLLFSNDVALGEKELSAGMGEYDTASKIFEKTLAAVKFGGDYPADLKMTKTKSIKAVVDKEIQAKILIVEKEFAKFKKDVNSLLDSEVNSLPYRQAQQNILIGSNYLRGLSGEVVALYSRLAEANQSEIKTAVIISSLLTLFLLVGIGFYLRNVIILPIQKISGVLVQLTNGNLSQTNLVVASNDEMGILSRACNQLMDNLQKFIGFSENILAGKNGSEDYGLEGDFERSLEGMLERAKEKQDADKEMAKVVALVENNTTGVMYANTSLVLQYVNPGGINILKGLQQHLAVTVDNVIGKNIDEFHQEPERIRRIVSNPKNLPHQAEIKLGDEVSSIVVSAIYDSNNEYLGPMLTWEIVTERVALETEAGEMAVRERVQADELKGKVDNMLEAVNAAGQGDLTQTINVKGDDVVGQLGEGLSRFLSGLRGSLSAIGKTSERLALSSEEMSKVSSQMAANAEQTSAQAGVVSAASEEISKNVQTAATGSEEMNASIAEIAQNANEAAKVANAAVKVAESTNVTISKLGDSSAEIGQVVKVITSIAEQTNLLALNATIEAARAGEAGKGFAVVANEVKELANQTARATEDIGLKIKAIQDDSKGAVDAIKEIGEVINKISDFNNTIASAVEEQTATTNEIGRNVSEAAKGSGEIAENITGVAKAADETSAGVNKIQDMALSLGKMSEELNRLVTQFSYIDAAKDLMTYDSSYSTGVTKMDDQHKILFRYVNDLYSALMADRGRDVMGDILVGLVDYTKFHFSEEEALLRKNGYPDLASHIGRHEALIKQVNEFYDNFKKGESEINFDLLTFLKDWLNGHIKTIDKQYGPYIKS